MLGWFSEATSGSTGSHGSSCSKCFLLCFLQDGPQAEGQSKTKQESAWLFRLWYTFDHKYPFCAPAVTEQKKVCA